MLSGAYRLIAESSLDEEQKLVAQSFLSTGVFEVAGGELLDTELSFTPNEAGDALKVARYKTASYTFITPILTGATLAGISDIQTKALNDYAQSIGIAYQLVDDLLGIFGSEDKTGKSTSSDIVEGKRTYMVEKALEVMEKHQQEEFFRAFGNQDATAEEIAAAKALLQTSGAKTATEELARSYATKAHDAITAMGLEERYAKEFENLVRLVTERSH